MTLGAQMGRRMGWVTLLAVFATFTVQNMAWSAAPAKPDWTQGSVEQVVGFYTQGRLINATRLPDAGNGFVKVFRRRNNPFGSYDLVTVISQIAASMRKDYPASERLQIGDLSSLRGGQLGGHYSHQLGLDADIVYYRVNLREMRPDTYDDFEEQFVERDKLSRNFDTERNWVLVSKLVATGRVSRIFVDSRIKRNFCAYARHIGAASTARGIETLRRLRHFPDHADHLHLRLNCPARSPRCVPQEEPPAGTGCESVMRVRETARP